MALTLPFLRTPQRVLVALVLGAAALVIGAFVMEYGFGAEPCKMCWWQRYGHWALLAIGVFALPFPQVRRCGVFALLLVVALVSGGIGLYQGLGQMGLVELPASCMGGMAGLSDNLLEALKSYKPEPSCAEKGFTVFGVSLAWWNVVAMSVYSLLCLYGLCRVRCARCKTMPHTH